MHNYAYFEFSGIFLIFLGPIPTASKKNLVQGIFAKIGPDLELRGGDLISSPVDSIVSLVSPKESYRPNSVGKNYFSATPFFTFSKNTPGSHNA